MSLLAVPIIAVIALIMSILCLVIIFMLITRHKTAMAVFTSQLQAQELFVNNIQIANDQLTSSVNKLSSQYNNALTESTLVSKQLEHRIKALQTQFNTQQEFIAQLQNEQGDDKFYSRAIKLAKKGADIDEIVAECELPHAEVEMLISVYQKKT